MKHEIISPLLGTKCELHCTWLLPDLKSVAFSILQCDMSGIFITIFNVSVLGSIIHAKRKCSNHDILTLSSRLRSSKDQQGILAHCVQTCLVINIISNCEFYCILFVLLMARKVNRMSESIFKD